MTFARGIHKSESLSEERIRRWEEECFMPYEDLSEDMKEKDRQIARKLLNLINNNKKS
jgi:hypothetical protein